MRLVYGPTRSYKDNVVEKKRRRFLFGLGWLAAGLTLALIAAIYMVFFSSWLELNSVVVSGTKDASSENLSTEIRNLVTKEGILNSQNNTLFFDSVRARKRLLALFPILESVSIDKKLPHQISVDVVERKPVGIWCFEARPGLSMSESAVSGGNCKFFDKEGYVWGQALKSYGSALITVDDPDAALEKLPKDILEMVLVLNQRLFEIGVYTNVFSIRDPLPEDIVARTNEGWDARFTSSYPIEEQLLSLKTLLGEEGYENPTEYVDLRIQGRAYYK